MREKIDRGRNRMRNWVDFRCREYRKKGRRHGDKARKKRKDRNGEKRKEGIKKGEKAETEIQKEIEGKIC
jgi:hypothetical protein